MNRWSVHIRWISPHEEVDQPRRRRTRAAGTGAAVASRRRAAPEVEIATSKSMERRPPLRRATSYAGASNGVTATNYDTFVPQKASDRSKREADLAAHATSASALATIARLRDAIAPRPRLLPARSGGTAGSRATRAIAVSLALSVSLAAARTRPPRRPRGAAQVALAGKSRRPERRGELCPRPADSRRP